MRLHECYHSLLESHGCGSGFDGVMALDVSLRATSYLSDFLPEAGKISLDEGSKVEDVISRLGINTDLVMLIVVDGELGDVDSPLEDGAVLELIPPISGG